MARKLAELGDRAHSNVCGSLSVDCSPLPPHGTCAQLCVLHFSNAVARNSDTSELFATVRASARSDVFPHPQLHSRLLPPQGESKGEGIFPLEIQLPLSLLIIVPRQKTVTTDR